MPRAITQMDPTSAHVMLDILEMDLPALVRFQTFLLDAIECYKTYSPLNVM